MSPSLHVLTFTQTIQPTTTLQALVNLKRPTLRLSPLVAQTSEDPSVGAESHDNHALEFEYDCDAPKCCITVQAIVSSNEPNTQRGPSPSSRRITVYESVFEGGFGRLLKLEDGATVDLGRFENIAARGSQATDVDHSPKVDTDLITAEITELPEGASQPNITSAPTSDHQDNARKRRFTALHFRRRSQNHSVSGPALAVVDNDAAATTEIGEREKESPNEDGVRVVIQLMALDDFGKELSSVNRQSTYLHVVRLGSPITGEEHKSWVVKVVKREATASTLHFVCKHPAIWLLYRLARIHFICMRSMVSPRHLHSPLYLPSTPLRTRIHPQPLVLQRMSHHLSVSYVLVHHVRSFFYHVAISSRVKNAPLIWSNSALGVQLYTRRNPL